MAKIYKIKSWRLQSGYGLLDFAFEAQIKMPAGMFRRITEERVDIVVDLIRQDMMLRLSTEDGEIPFKVVPSDYLTIDGLARKHAMDYEEVQEHLEFLEGCGIVEFFSQSKIKTIFWDERDAIKSFAKPHNDFRSAFYDKTAPELEELVRNVLQNMQVITYPWDFTQISRMDHTY